MFCSFENGSKCYRGDSQERFRNCCSGPGDLDHGSVGRWQNYHGMYLTLIVHRGECRVESRCTIGSKLMPAKLGELCTHQPARSSQTPGLPSMQMDLLAGRLQRISEMSIKGEVLVNNEPIDYRRFRHSTGYVTQHDYLPPTETVRECLMFSAQLRLSSGLTHAQRRQRVDSILDELVRLRIEHVMCCACRW